MDVTNAPSMAGEQAREGETREKQANERQARGRQAESNEPTSKPAKPASSSGSAKAGSSGGETCTKKRALPFTTMRFTVSNALSILGNSVAGVVIPLILLARTGDALAAGTLALICAVPQMLVGLMGGALLDRINRRDVSIVSDIISAGSVAMLPIVDMIWGLDFTWFVVLGLLGAIGDIPGMTARDTLLPEVVKHDRIDLQRYLGITQSLESLVTIIGPALAALLIGFGSESSALWVIAALSTLAALVTLTLPRSLGAIPKAKKRGAREDAPLNARGAQDAHATGKGGRAGADGLQSAAAKAASKESLFDLMRASFVDGWRTLFKENALLRASVLLGLGIIMVLGSFQGLVLPVHFTQIAEPANLGYVLSAMAGGLLVGSLVYTALARKLSKHAWMIVSLLGMGAGVLGLALLPPFPLMLGVSVLLGFCAGPASALMGFIVFDRLPPERRGTALGTQNAIVLVVAPVAVFATSVVVEVLGVTTGALILGGCWIAVTLWALCSRGLRGLK